MTEPLVLKFASRFAAYGIPKDELVVVGNLALVEVADRFEPERVSTYASHWVRGAMLAFIVINYSSFTMKSQKMKKQFFRLRDLIHREQEKNGELDEIMQRMSVHFGTDHRERNDDYRGRELIRSAMDRVLNHRERTIVEELLREDGNERTLQDLADQFDLSRERVRQIRNDAFSKLERAIRCEAPS